MTLSAKAVRKLDYKILQDIYIFYKIVFYKQNNLSKFIAAIRWWWRDPRWNRWSYPKSQWNVRRANDTGSAILNKLLISKKQILIFFKNYE